MTILEITNAILILLLNALLNFLLQMDSTAGLNCQTVVFPSA